MKTPAQRFALVGGLVYVLVGLVGFAVTGFSHLADNTGDALLVFDLNPLHNIIHVATGAALVAAALSPFPQMAAGASFGAGAVLTLVALVGFTNNLQILSIDSALAADNGLHLATGLVAMAFGVLGRAPLGAKAAPPVAPTDRTAQAG